METTWIEIGGVTIRSPVTAGTSLLLAVQCALYFARLRTGGADARGLWARFFLAMAVATLTGVPKHGMPHTLQEATLLAVLWTSSLASGASVLFAQRAAIAAHASARFRSTLERVVGLQVLTFLAATYVLGPEMSVIVANTAAGLIPVIVVEGRAGRTGHAGSAWIAGGLSVSMLTAVVYVGGLALGRWFNHVDFAHVLMGVSFYMIMRGAAGDTL